MKTVSIVIPCYNEEGNVEEVYKQIKQVFEKLPEYNYEYIFIDNDSNDNTQPILRNLAEQDKRVKVIINSRNFGVNKSSCYAFFQALGDAVILTSADLQDPPELIFDFVKKWEEGYKIVLGIKEKSDEPPLIHMIKNLAYRVINKISEIDIINYYSAYGLFDRKVMDIFRDIKDPYPYFRGLVCEVGYEKAYINYVRNQRQKGKSSVNAYFLYDAAMIAITNYSVIPIRMAVFIGAFLTMISLIAAFAYVLCKLIFWTGFSFGLTPVIIGLFFILSLQLFFTGIIGEYLRTIYIQVIKRPSVFEKERINF